MTCVHLRIWKRHAEKHYEVVSGQGLCGTRTCSVCSRTCFGSTSERNRQEGKERRSKGWRGGGIEKEEIRKTEG